MLYHYAGKSCDHKHCDGGDITYLIFHVIFREHMFKGLCEFVGGATVSHHLVMLGGYWSSASEDIK